MNWIQKARTVLGIVSEALAVYSLGKSSKFKSLFTDGTSRNQSARHCISIAAQDQNCKILAPILLTANIIPSDEKCESLLEMILSTLQDKSELLREWASICKRLFPDYCHDIPDPSSIDVTTLASGGTVNTDTCNTAKKLKQILIEEIEKKALEIGIPKSEIKLFGIDCMHHLRNIWIKASNEAVADELRVELKDDIDALQKQQLRVSLNFSELLLSFSKCFCKSAQYDKGMGAEFYEFMSTHYQDHFLFPLPRVKTGTRQDVKLIGAPAIYLNRKYYEQFLDHKLLSDSTNILLRTCEHYVSSLEIIATARMNSILYLCLCLPHRWLTGKCHTFFPKHKFGQADLSRVLDIMYSKFEMIINEPSLFIDNEFMCSIFDSICVELPPFNLYMDSLLTGHNMKVHDGSDSIEGMKFLRHELFCPVDYKKFETDDLTIRLGLIAIQAWYQEFKRNDKQTCRYLSELNGESSWGSLNTNQRNQLL